VGAYIEAAGDDLAGCDGLASELKARPSCEYITDDLFDLASSHFSRNPLRN
jgi:hypothetical protein